MTEKEILDLEKEQKRRNEKSQEYYTRLHRISCLSDILKKPKFFNRCPTCNQKLLKNSYGSYKHWICECGYEYVEQMFDDCR